MDEKKKSDKLEEKVTHIKVVTDGHHGHYGSCYCGHCNVNLPEHYRDICPRCGYIFKGIRDETPPGGSDF